MMPALIALIILIGIFMALEALGFSVALSVFVDGHGFWDGWHAAWGRPGWLFFFAIITMLTRGADR